MAYMSTTYTNVRLSQVDENGNVNVLYPESNAGQISISSANNPNVSGFASLQQLINALARSAFTEQSTVAEATLAEKLKNTRYLDGIAFNGARNVIHYATCSSAADSTAKVAQIPSNGGVFELSTGATIKVKFTYANTASGTLSLQVNWYNDSGSVVTGTAKNIMEYGTTAKTSSTTPNWKAGDVVEFVYDGTNWIALPSHGEIAALNSDLKSATYTASSGHKHSQYLTSHQDISGKAPNNHASTATTYGIGTSSNYGHTKIINALTQSSHSDGTALSAYQGKVLNDSISGKAPNNHASTSTTYGIGTSSNYGHTKIINSLTQSSHADGTALSAYQGKVLNDKITTLEGNFNTALTQLYNACVNKGSTPSNNTISAIVNAVNNIEEANYGDLIDETGDIFTWSGNILTGIAQNTQFGLYNQPQVVPQYRNGSRVVLQ